MQSPRHSTLFLFTAATLTLTWINGCSSPKDSQVGINVAEEDGGPHGSTAASTPTGKQPAVSPAPNGGSTNPASAIAIPKKGSIAVEVSDNGAVVVTCGGSACACNDGIDNDADGVTDGFDAECTGPFDGDEGSFATGIPGDNRDPKWQDCFFDGNSGAGDDGCRYPTTCLDGTLEASDPKCEVANSCRDACAPLAPPGCDCFGCCDVRVNGALHTIVISDSCSTERIDDTAACSPCVKSATCQNECGDCELCLGKTLADLPAKCFVNSAPSTPPPATTPPPPATTPPTTPSTPVAPPSMPSSSAEVPSVPPGNVCDFGVACSSSSECPGGYCALGCCRELLQ